MRGGCIGPSVERDTSIHYFGAALEAAGIVTIALRDHGEAAPMRGL
jgi:hypothetical protein